MNDAITTMDEAYAMYDEFFNEISGEINVAGYTFDASDILKKMDPIAYRVGFDDYMDAIEVDTDELEDDADL